MMKQSIRKPRITKTRENNNLSRGSERLKAARASLTMRASRIRLAWRLILVAGLICLAAIVWLSQTSYLVGLGYDIEKMEKKKVTLERQSTQLQAQIAQYEDLKRVEDEARTKLGMIPAKKVVYVKVPANQAERGPEPINSTSAQGNDWWRDLLEMLPQLQKPVAADPNQARK